MGGGGGQRVCWPPSQIIGRASGPPPPSSYAYEDMLDKTYSWLRLCYAKPISGKGYAEQNLIILRDSVVKICKTGCFQVKMCDHMLHKVSYLTQPHCKKYP